jgi:hypothetical protein
MGIREGVEGEITNKLRPGLNPVYSRSSLFSLKNSLTGAALDNKSAECCSTAQEDGPSNSHWNSVGILRISSHQAKEVSGDSCPYQHATLQSNSKYRRKNKPVRLSLFYADV